VLTITPGCSAVSAVSVTGATPFGPIVFAVSPTAGPLPLTGSCAGVVLGINLPTILFIAPADAAGNFNFALYIPPVACGLFVQAFDIASCGPTNVVQLGAPGTTFPFPSATSKVIGSVGFIDSQQVGYFWDVGRGDSVSETFTGPPTITSYALDVDVITNVLNSGAFVNWNVWINGVLVDNFTVNEGFTGTVSRSTGGFGTIFGPVYSVDLQVTNTVPGGMGSHTFRYAGTGMNQVTLSP
jgi:hypothetical protein